MTDPDLVEKKLAFIESCVADLRRLAILDNLENDVKERRFVEHTLQLAIQACLDAASHVVSDDRLGEPHTNQELFRLPRRLDAYPRILPTTCAPRRGSATFWCTATPRSTAASRAMCWKTISRTYWHSRRHCANGPSYLATRHPDARPRTWIAPPSTQQEVA
jgi:hypothetical protein